MVSSAHVTFGFWRGAELADPAGRLEGGERMKHVKLRSAANVDEGLLTTWLVEAAGRNLRDGDPTRRKLGDLRIIEVMESDRRGRRPARAVWRCHFRIE